MNDDESIKLVELAFAWVEFRNTLQSDHQSLAIRTSADSVETAIEGLIAAGERDASERMAGVHKSLQSIARQNVRRD